MVRSSRCLVISSNFSLSSSTRAWCPADVIAVEQDDRGRDPLTLLVRNNDGLSVLVDIRARRVSGSQVDPVNARLRPSDTAGTPVARSIDQVLHAALCVEYTLP